MFQKKEKFTKDTIVFWRKKIQLMKIFENNHVMMISSIVNMKHIFISTLQTSLHTNFHQTSLFLFSVVFLCSLECIKIYKSYNVCILKKVGCIHDKILFTKLISTLKNISNK